MQTTFHFEQLAIAPSLIQAENNVKLPNGATYTLQGSITNGNVVTNEVRIYYKEVNSFLGRVMCIINVNTFALLRFFIHCYVLKMKSGPSNYNYFNL